MLLPPFTLHRPRSVAEACRLLAELGDDAAAYCGGTELLLAMKLGLTGYPHLVDLKQVAELRGIELDGGALRIGAAATHHEIETSAAVRATYPELAGMLTHVANLRVRSVGTIGGNLCFADPHSDPATFLIAVDATLLCQHGNGGRSVPAREFFTGPYQTVLQPGELVTAIELPARRPGTGIAHVRMKLHERPVVTVTAMLRLDRGTVSLARLAVGSVTAIPLLVPAAGELEGTSPADFDGRGVACAEQAGLGCEPLSNGECSTDYLRHLVNAYSRRALRGALAAAVGQPPAAPGADPIPERGHPS